MSNKDNFVEVADTDEEEEYSEMGVYLKENYDLQDFLNYTKTRDILNKNSRWVYENKMDDIIAAFYKGEIDFNKADNSTLFANEQNYKRLGIFQAMIYTCLEPKYDLEIFYLNPIFAKDMVESMDERILESKRARISNIRNNYLQNKDTKENKVNFNWSTKTYK